MESKVFYDTVEQIIDLWYNKMDYSETVCRIVLMYVFKSHGMQIENGLDPAISSAIDKFIQQSDVEKNQVV